MNALVVYESLWGNTKAVAEAIARGIGGGAVAVSTSEASHERVAQADLLVVGAPLLGFNLPSQEMRRSIESNPAHASHRPDLSHPTVRDWLETVPPRAAWYATFETRIWWSPGSSAKRIAKALESAGYRQVAPPQRFIVKGSYGPLRTGELERAQAWGEELARFADAAGA